MPDNGYGTKANSADYLLRVYHVTPDFKTARGGHDRGRPAPRCRAPARRQRQQLPFSTGRNPILPDDNDFIVVRTGSLKNLG
jgi:hypothetical protein